MTTTNEEFDLGILEEDTPKQKASRAKPKTEASASAPQRHLVYISETEDGPGFVSIGVNGKVYQIRCGEQVSVPTEVLNVLRESIATKYHKEMGPDGKETLVGRDYPSVPFQYLGPDMAGA